MNNESRERIVFHTHHKCATIWLNEYLSSIAKENGLNYRTTHYSNVLPDGDVVLLTNSSYDFVKEKKVGGIHIVRNPMSIVVSAYFSHLTTHSLDGWESLSLQRSVLRSEDRASGFFLTLAFLERADFYDGAIGPLYGIRIWDYADPSFLTIRMEDAVREPEKTVREALRLTGYAKITRFPPQRQFDFVKFSGGREIGIAEEGSHFRSGNPDDWKEHLPQPIVNYVRTHFQPFLAKFYPDVLVLE